MANEKRLIDANELKRRMLAFATSIKRDFLSIEAIIDRIDTESTVDAVEVVHGRWIYKWDAERDPKKLFVRVVCSACNLHTGQKSNYCPYCGAKMCCF